MFRGTVLLCFLKTAGLLELGNCAGGVRKSRECPGEAGELQAELAALLLIQALLQVFLYRQESPQNGNCSEAKEFYVCVKILREDKNCPGSTQLVKWMLGCYDALQKKYVYTQPEDPQTVTECYHFKFKYTHNGPLLDFGSKDKKSDSTITCADTKKASILLIRKIYILMQNLSPLPNDVCLTMKLLYYDEVTPPDYQPPGFREAKDGGLMFNEEPMYLNVGEVPTPFHMLKLKITTEKQRMENVDKNILKQGETAELLQVCGVSRDDPEEESQEMNEDPALDNEVEDKNHVNISEAQENNSTHEEEAGGMQTLPCVSNPQVDHLTRKTSELIVSESRTRSGKIFQSCIVQQRAELSSSQDVVPKRRKLSEPKEQF
ncbi:HORMA domain-containing protein 1 isoform X3 [Chamaea fasciata]|uniref:HORMA domain-containing protein 1 isoform X3 n=1 Tax=Chamaea fasciata TaxID=190680 RepID=UPI00336A1664